MEEPWSIFMTDHYEILLSLFLCITYSYKNGEPNGLL